MEAICRSVYSGIESREPGVTVKEVCSCVGEYAPAMYERISGASNFRQVYQSDMPRPAMLEQLLQAPMLGCAILHTRTP